VHINVRVMRVRVTIVAVEKTSIKYSRCVSEALFIQHAKCTLSILLASVFSQVLPYFFTLTRKGKECY
jgi:hypothetical protein